MAFCSFNSFNRISIKRRPPVIAIVYGTAPTDYVAYIAMTGTEMLNIYGYESQNPTAQ